MVASTLSNQHKIWRTWANTAQPIQLGQILYICKCEIFLSSYYWKKTALMVFYMPMGIVSDVSLVFLSHEIIYPNTMHVLIQYLYQLRSCLNVDWLVWFSIIITCPTMGFLQAPQTPLATVWTPSLLRSDCRLPSMLSSLLAGLGGTVGDVFPLDWIWRGWKTRMVFIIQFRWTVQRLTN